MTGIVSSIIFIGVIGGFIPVAAWLSKRALDQGLRVPRLDFYLETVIIQTLLVALALWVARANDLAIQIAPARTARSVLVAVALLLVALLSLLVGWRWSGPDRRERMRMIVPSNREETVAWAGVSLTAGLAEELIYRGVLFGLFYTWSRQFWLSAILAATLFALAHLVQGWVAVAIVFGYGLLFQLLYEATGSLFGPILVHVMYDFIAGVMIARWSRESDDEEM